MSSHSSSTERVAVPTTFLAALRHPHETFAASRRFTHVRRAPYLQKLYNHVSSNNPPLVVSAPSGAGKSALLAYWIAEYRKHNPGAFVVEHYIGCGEGTPTAHHVIRHIMLEIKERYNLPQEIPATSATLVSEFPAWIWYIHEPCVLVIDGMDQLKGKETNWEWIPEKIPDACTLILSTSDENLDTALKVREWEVLTIAPLTSAERRNVVRQFVSERRLGSEHHSLTHIAEDHFSSNPLLLRVRLEEAYRVTDGTTDDPIIASYLSAPSIEDLYAKLLNRLQDQFGPDIVARTFGFISAAQHPLSEGELSEILGHPAQLPALLERLKFHISDGQHSLRYYHNSFRNVADAQFFATPETRQRIRTQLIEFFLRAAPSSRSTTEVAGQFAALAEWEALGRYITRGENLLLLYQPESASQYLQHWHHAEMHQQNNLADLLVESLEKFREANTNREQTADALQAGGDICRLTGATEIAARLYETMLIEAQNNTSNTALLARAHSRLGTIKELLGLPREAEDALHHALRYAKESDSNELLTATIRGNIGNLLFRQGKFKQALEMHRVNLQVTEEAGDMFSTARVLNNLGSTYQRLGDQEQAMKCFQRSRKIAETTSNMVLRAQVAGNMAVIESERGNFQEALKLCKEQREAAEQTDRKRFVAISHVTAANVYLSNADYNLAIEHYQHCQAIAQQASIPHMQGVALDGIGRCYAQLKRYNAAEKTLQAALQMFRACEDPHRIGSTEEALSLLAFNQGNYHKALEGYRNVFIVFKNMGLQRTLLETRKTIGKTLLRLGQLEKAEQEFGQMLSDAQKLKDARSIALAHFGQGYVALEGENINQALNCFGLGLDALTISPKEMLPPHPHILPLFVEGLRAGLLWIAEVEREHNKAHNQQNVIQRLLAYAELVTPPDPTVTLFTELIQEALKAEASSTSFLAILSAAPNNEEAHAEATFIIARLFAQQGQQQEARILFEEANQRYTSLLIEKPETELYRIRLRRMLSPTSTANYSTPS